MNVEDYLPEVARQTKGCPDLTLEYAIVRAARRFCAESWFIRRAATVSTVANTQQYTLGLSSAPQEEIVALKSAQITVSSNTRPLGFDPSSSFDPNSSAGVPVMVAYVPYDKITLYPTPADVYAVTATVITQPKKTATRLPGELDRKYYQHVAAGALSWVLSMEGEVWSNPQEAARQEAIFKSGIANAKADAANDFIPGGQRIRPRPFIV